MSVRAFMLVTGDDAKLLAGIEKLIGTTIPEVALDGFAVDTSDNEDQEPPARARRPSGRKTREAAAEAPSPEPDEMATSTAAPPPRHRSNRPTAPKSEPIRRSANESRRRQRADEDQDEPETVVGFGNRIPAFLQAVPRPRRD
jgi:hypothetical protein